MLITHLLEMEKKKNENATNNANDTFKETEKKLFFFKCHFILSAVFLAQQK